MILRVGIERKNEQVLKSSANEKELLGGQFMITQGRVARECPSGQCVP